MVLRFWIARGVRSDRQDQQQYWWRDEVQNEDAFILTFKTPRRLFGLLVDLLKKEHSYDVPEITALPVLEGSDEYLGWIREETAAGQM